MGHTTFTEIATRYERDSIIQKSAAEKLISLLQIGSDDAVLDLGCGAGNLTRKLREQTSGPVVGIDPTATMIETARAGAAGQEIIFLHGGAEELPFTDTFDVVFCNSAFQWFNKPSSALASCYRALRPGGRIGIQAPSKTAYCPNFIEAVGEVARDPRTAATFAGFRSPWLFLETVDDYRELFRNSGFTVSFAVIEEQVTPYTPEDVVTIFESGAAAGYLNRDNYDTDIDEEYGKAFREIIAGAFRSQAGPDGRVDLIFNRVYLVAVKD